MKVRLILNYRTTKSAHLLLNTYSAYFSTFASPGSSWEYNFMKCFLSSFPSIFKLKQLKKGLKTFLNIWEEECLSYHRDSLWWTPHATWESSRDSDWCWPLERANLSHSNRYAVSSSCFPLLFYTSATVRFGFSSMLFYSSLFSCLILSRRAFLCFYFFLLLLLLLLFLLIYVH